MAPTAADLQMHHSGARLVEFSFASMLAADCTDEDVLRLVRQSWKDNGRAGITGRLRLDDRRLDQVLEGPSAVVLAVSVRILTDPRHGWIEIRAFGPIGARRHEGWSVEGLTLPEPVAVEPQKALANLHVLPRAALTVAARSSARAAGAP